MIFTKLFCWHFFTLIICIAGLTFCRIDFVVNISREDGIIENITAFIYLLAVVAAALALSKREHKALSIFWLCCCIVFLGEETSWFQRVFNYSVPAVEHISNQNEFNIHNLEALQGSMHHSGGILSLLNPQNYFRIGFFGYFIAVPFLFGITGNKHRLMKLGYVEPALDFRVLVLLLFTIAFGMTIICEAPRHVPLAEFRELLYAYFILLYVALYLVGSRSQANRLAPNKNVG